MSPRPRSAEHPHQRTEAAVEDLRRALGAWRGRAAEVPRDVHWYHVLMSYARVARPEITIAVSVPEAEDLARILDAAPRRARL